MKLNDTVYKALNSNSKIKLLKFLLSGRHIPDMSERELARMVGISNAGVNRAMGDFQEMNLVYYKDVGHSHVWSVNEKSHAYKSLKNVVSAFVQNGTPIDSLKTEIITELKRLPVVGASLFGSVARGDEKSNSDVDLFILVKSMDDKKTVEKAMEDFGIKILKTYGNTLGQYILTEGEYRKKKSLNVIKNIDKEGLKLI